MKFSDYIAKHRASAVEILRTGETEWIVYNSQERARPNGDPFYKIGDRPRWSADNPTILVPVSEETKALASTMHAKEEVAWRIRGDHLKLFQTSTAKVRHQLWFDAQLDAPRNGNWFELVFDDVGKLHVWYSDKSAGAPRLTWRMAPEFVSRIAGQQVVGDHVAKFGLRTNSSGVEGLQLYLLVHPDTGSHDRTPQVVWDPQSNGHTATFRGFAGAGHQLRWSPVRDGHIPEFRRTVLVRPSSTVGEALGLKRALELEVLQRPEGDEWALQCVHALSDPPELDSSIDVVSRFRRAWDELLAAPAHRGLAVIRQGAGAGAIPEIGARFNPAVTHWLHEYRFPYATTPDADCSAEFKLVRSEYTNHDGVPLPLANQRHAARLVWPALLDDTGQPLKARDGVMLATRKGAKVQPETQGDDGTVFEWFIQGLEVEGRVRDGALDLGFGGRLDGADEARHDGRLRALLHLRDEQRPLFLFQWEDALRATPVVLSYAVEELTFGVASISPGAQDARPEDEYLPPATSGSVIQGAGERAEPSLVFPLGRRTAGAAAPTYLWIANESTNVAQSMRSDVRIERYRPDPAVDETHVVVLDAAPQLVAQVDFRFAPQTTLDSGTNIVARRSPLSVEQGGWEFLDERARIDGFVMRLPAQALGEQTVKRKLDFPEDTVADSRFGAPVLLRLAPERLARGFVAVSWNLRRILLDRGNASPGAPLLEADFELLYGLAARVKHPGLLLAELGAKIGELPTPALPKPEWPLTRDQTAAFRTSWQQFLRAYRAWMTRLCVLEVSHEHDPLRPLILNEGVEYRARVQAESDQTGKLQFVKGASLAWPEPYDGAPSASQPMASPPEDLAAYHRDDGLKGGACWGFDQLEIYREFWRHHTRSSSGELRDLAFTSIGGYGKQTARFANDKTTIQSVTSLGRTHYYAVERIGRIGACWNRAKHVIEYERVTVPSQQFAAEQHAHAGRALLRRVREFIEILEPTHVFPDIPGQDVSAPGSLRACVFRTRILPVHSSWGRTVYRRKRDTETSPTAIGWEIPLWRTGLDPEVYPKPQVSLLLAPAAADGEAVSVDLEQPEVLHFYTDVREKDEAGNTLTADVMAWPVVEGVDYTDQPDPAIPNVAPAEASEGPGLDGRLPGALLVPPGFERFTLRVTPSDLPADIAGSYYKDAHLTGRMRTATLMRSVPNPANTDAWWAGTDAPEAKNARVALRHLVDANADTANGFTDIVRQLRAGRPPDSKLIDEIKDTTKVWLTGAAAAAAQVKDKLDPPPRKGNHFEDLYGAMIGATEGMLQTSPGRALWREVLDGADGVVARVVNHYGEMAQAFLAEFAALSTGVAPSADSIGAAVTRLLDRLQAFTVRVDFMLPEAFGLVHAQIDQQSERVALDLRAQFQTRVLNKLADIRAQVGEDLVQAKQRLRETLDDAVAAAERIVDGLSIAILAKPLAALKARIKQRIGDLATKVGAAIAAQEQSVDALFARFAEEVRAQLDNAQEGLTRTAVRNLADAAHSIVEVAQAQLDERHDEIVPMIADVLTDLDRSLRDLSNLAIPLDQHTRKLKEVLNGCASTLTTTLKQGIRALLVGKDWTKGQEPTPTSVYSAVRTLDHAFAWFARFIGTLLGPLAGGLAGAVDTLFDRLAALDGLKQAIEDGELGPILDRIEKVATEINAEIGAAAGEAAALARELAGEDAAVKETAQAAKNVLRNARSVWDEFTAPGLGFNRRTVEMIVKFDPQRLDERLGITPCVARVKQLGDKLEGLGLRLPVVGVADRLLPAMADRFQELTKSLLKQFNFSDLLSDIGGLRLTKLLPGLKMPDWAGDRVHITHGFDKEQLKCWVNAETDIVLAGKKTLMSIGPLLVTLTDGSFAGKVRLEMDARGRVEKVARGAMIGDWTIAVSGLELMAYEKLAIRFEDGKLDFDLDPSRMRSPGLLQLLTDASQAIPFAGEGFKFGLVKDGQYPVGVRADLEIGPFGASGGVSGISNLLFGAFFQLRFIAGGKFAFSLATGFHVGKREAPFDLQVSILGGGGYLDFAIDYEPGRARLSADIALAVHASASLRIDAGWLRGGVAIYLGLEAEYHKRPDSSPAWNAGLFVMIEGYATLYGLVTISLSLRLNCTFRPLGNRGMELAGAGTVIAQVRVSRFFKLKVHRSYERVIARRAGQSVAAASPPAGPPASIIAAAAKPAKLSDDVAAKCAAHINMLAP